MDNLNGTILGGTPDADAGGAYVFTLEASNGGPTAAVQTFTLSVDQAPAITSAASATFTMGQVNFMTVTTAGFPAPTFTIVGRFPRV